MPGGKEMSKLAKLAAAPNRAAYGRPSSLAWVDAIQKIVDTPERMRPMRFRQSVATPIGFDAVTSKLNERKDFFPSGQCGIPGLEHGLDRVVSQGVAPIRFDNNHKKLRFDEYLRVIRQPDELHMHLIGGFIPSSKCQTLRKVADGLPTSPSFVSSTSSMSGLLSKMFFAIAGPRKVNLRPLPSFHRTLDTFTKITFNPAEVTINPSPAGFFAIDAYKEEEEETLSNTILIELGKSLERMLTLKEHTFNDLLVHGKDDVVDPFPEAAYHFMQHGNFLLRAQLDCEQEDKIFDIKTRATSAVRHNCDEYYNHLDYRITRISGFYHSFEREFYDMLRATFLKYSFQLRIGNMDGAFVTYHNTAEIFGFQYVPLSLMDHLIFGSPSAGRVYFDRAMKMIDALLTRILEDHGDKMPVRLQLGMSARQLQTLVAVVKSVDGVELACYSIEVQTAYNGRRMVGGVDIMDSDEFQVFHRIQRISGRVPDVRASKPSTRGPPRRRDLTEAQKA